MALAYSFSSCSFSVWYIKTQNVGKDLGGAIKGFKEGMKEAQDEFEDKPVAKESSIEKSKWTL